MSNTFKPGDRVRRTGESRPSEGMIQGDEYIVTETSASGSLWVPGLPYPYDHLLFELVEPAPVEFQKGDRVRARSKTTDDTAEFTVTYVGETTVQSHANTYSRHYFDFELLARPVPPKPPLPTRLGSVVRITEFGGFRQNYVALLTAGGWHVHTDTVPYGDLGFFSRNNPEFELVYEPEN